MGKYIDLKPKKRSKLRLMAGRAFYTTKKNVDWLLPGKKFCSKKGNLHDYPIVIFSHSTPLLRELKKVDMWLQYNKITNLQIAIPNLDCILIEPGEILSYWKLIGKPTRRKGYLPGMQLDNGSFKAATGGGLCQLSNLIYWMTLHTPLTVVERWRHSYDVFPDSNRTQPFGSGATCSYNYIDLQLKNNQQKPFLLHLYLTDTHLVGEWRSTTPLECKYEIYERNHWITSEYWGGFVRHNIIARKIFDLKGELINDEYITENHAVMMYEPLLSASKNTG